MQLYSHEYVDNVRNKKEIYKATQLGLHNVDITR